MKKIIDMENEKINNGIKEIKNIKMTPSERAAILRNILPLSDTAPKPIPSPFSFYSLLKQHSFQYVLASLLVLIVGGGTIATSQKSLPGNVLYPLKVNFLEPINSSLNFSPETKAKYENSLVKERLLETETLARQGKLDSAKEKQINELLSTHTVAFNKAINELKKTDQKEQITNITTELQNQLSENTKKIVAMKNPNDTELLDPTEDLNNPKNEIAKIDLSKNGTDSYRAIKDGESDTSSATPSITRKEEASIGEKVFSVSMGNPSQNKKNMSLSINKGLRKVFALYKNGQISECFENGKLYYSASLNAYDGEGGTFDSLGTVVGKYQGFTGKYTGISPKNCERIYVIYPNIWGLEGLNKYNLE